MLSGYYFSIDNLSKDLNLRKHMDSQGFVPLNFIASLKRVKLFNIDVLRSACTESDIIELRRDLDGVDRIRRKEDWEKWTLPMQERDLSARSDDPRQLPTLPKSRVRELTDWFEVDQSSMKSEFDDQWPKDIFHLELPRNPLQIIYTNGVTGEEQRDGKRI